ncbi:MAG TPA: hypothetical protein VMU63_02005 [Acidimicrobiales bacterium]|nr:hypothetical protein [Acidimicrobiales bacterium]
MAGSATADGREMARRYAPLGGIVVVLLLAFLVLPSSLTLPQANPSTTLELAPIPPSGARINAPLANFSSLSLAGTSTLGTGTGPGAGGGLGSLSPLPVITPGSGSLPPEVYQCVGGRQTSDPLSPPCSAYRYQGDNGGSTYQGVTAGLIKILIYFDANGTLNTARGADSPTPNTIINLDDPPQPNEVGSTFINRGWEHYFNLHYQTYNRHVQFWVQYGSLNSSGVADANTRAADAAFGYSTVHPFAALDYGAFGGYQDTYNNYMLSHDVLIFGSQYGRTESLYQKYPGLQWGYLSPIEQGAQFYANMVCTKVKSLPTSYAGATLNGKPRKYAFMADGDPASVNYQKEDQEVLADLKATCGLVPSETVSFPHDGYAIDNSELPTYATENMAKLSSDGVTSILWPAGFEVKQSQAAQEINYTPEWIMGDDANQACNFCSDFQSSAEWDHAVIMSSVVYTPPLPEQVCYQQYRTIDSQAADSDVDLYACDGSGSDYNDLRQLFDGIQVAGPKLTPHTIDEGFHAIPAVASSNPQVPACYYQANDYTCIKDAVIEWWDSTGQDPNSSSKGCWRMVDNGQRFLNGQFPPGNINAQFNPSDTCNGFGEEIQEDAAP